MVDPLSMPTYAGRASLVRWLDEQADEAYNAIGRYRVLGCGTKPYEPLFAPHVGLGFVARPLGAAINTVAAGIDSRSARLREPGPGGLFANFHVLAEAPR